MKRFAPILGLLALVAVALPAQAQLRLVHAPEPVAAGQTANVFIEALARDLVGLRVEVAPGWTLAAAQATRDGGALLGLPLDVLGSDHYGVATEALARGRHLVVLTLVAGETPGVAPLQVSARGQTPLRWEALVRPAQRPLNPAFKLADGAEPLLLRRRALPSLDAREPLTVEFWLRTTGLGEVVLSTWDGDPERAYPFEVIVDRRGRLAIFRGQPGFHEALLSPEPVADGTWRHVAFVHDPARGRSRLLLDGVVVDSLRTRENGALSTLPLALGGRAARAGAQVHPFTGLLDELRLWPSARSADAVRSAKRLPLDAPPPRVARFGFEEDLPAEALARVPAHGYRALADLALAFPIEDFEAEEEGGFVTLTWRTRDRAAAFVVERSPDGERFEVVGRVERGQSAGGGVRYRFSEPLPGRQVVFYRVRRVDEAQPGRTDVGVSSVLKLGLGAAEEAVPLAFLGNSPNPFQGMTTLTFTVPESGPVLLTVWSITGARVATLLQGTLPAGRHEVRFDAADLPSGVYFARLQTPGGTAAHRMTRAN